MAAVRLLPPAVVYFVAAVFAGLPFAAVLYGGLGVVLEAVGFDSAAAADLVLFVLSVLVGLQLAVELTAVHSAGVGALTRGSTAGAVARFVPLALGALAVIVTIFVRYSSAS
ncbi:hypothetical protein [Natrononativus amylolyticus]|uniref:hypothetical protein n=1 Tax=Natrononativus amylolyticus TaxID=2963434 RepID=UPI0020CE7251|nr:hypothetical protein [Natrononativus amylolyticus]